MDTSTTQPRIKSLPADAISHLRSTVTLTGLPGVVQQLLMNSIDASSTNITLHINIVKNSVTSEDNGNGVVPDDVKMLGLRYATSKSAFSPTATFGSRGEFLSSLSTSSLLTVYTRSKNYRSTHAVRYHYGSRLICGQVENDSLTLRNSGTKVVVDKLFGNYPVRVMGREQMTSVEITKEWRDIGRKILEVLLLHQTRDDWKGIKVVVRDEKGIRKAAFDTSAAPGEEGRGRWARLLEQAGFSRSQWETVEAEWNGIQIRGMMGLAPLSDLDRQFIFLNGSPISRSSNSILYTRINSLFTASSFGMIDENTPPSESKSRIVVRKGIEKHPSFVLFVTTASATKVMVDDLELESGNNILVDVTRLLDSVVDEFLRVGGWKRRVMHRNKQAVDEDVAMEGGEPEFPTKRTDNLLYMNVMSKAKTSAGLKPKKVNGNVHLKSRAEARPSTATSNSDTLSYFDAKTGTHIALDPRTGNVIKEPPVSKTRGRLSLISQETGPFGKPTTKASRWASSVVSSFKNPVIGLAEAAIPSSKMATEDLLSNNDGNMSKIPKTSLQTARVINQVDDKYVLLLLQSPELLVIVDQHAADERIRVERLWRDYDSQPKPLSRGKRPPLSFTVAADEAVVMVPWLDGMKEWGFEFDVTATDTHGTDSVYNVGGARVEVLGLPELVADRCSSEPLVVVNLVRNWIAELKESGGGFKKYPSQEEGWIKRMVSATKGLGEVVSSRACRSAIMFNDKLSLQECQALIDGLAQCDFPFQCAHGRPSMVPILDVADGGVEDPWKGDGDCCGGCGGSGLVP